MIFFEVAGRFGSADGEAATIERITEDGDDLIGAVDGSPGSREAELQALGAGPAIENFGGEDEGLEVTGGKRARARFAVDDGAAFVYGGAAKFVERKNLIGPVGGHVWDDELFGIGGVEPSGGSEKPVLEGEFALFAVVFCDAIGAGIGGGDFIEELGEFDFDGNTQLDEAADAVATGKTGERITINGFGDGHGRAARYALAQRFPEAEGKCANQNRGAVQSVIHLRDEGAVHVESGATGCGGDSGGAGADPELPAQDTHPLHRMSNDFEDAVVRGRKALECFQNNGADVAAVEVRAFVADSELL